MNVFLKFKSLNDLTMNILYPETEIGVIQGKWEQVHTAKC